MSRTKKASKPIDLLKEQMNFGKKTERCPFCRELITYRDAYIYGRKDLFVCCRIVEPDEEKYSKVHFLKSMVVMDMEDGKKIANPKPCLKVDWLSCPLNVK